MKYRKILALFLCGAFLLTGCGSSALSESSDEAADTSTATDGHATVSTVSLTEGKYSDEKLDASWDAASAVTIHLSSSPETSDEEAVSIDGTLVTITQAGTYVLSGELDGGQIIVDAQDQGDIKLVLNGVSIRSESSSALYIKEGKTVVVLADDTENTITDSATYAFEEGEDEPDAAIFSHDDLSFNGTGTLAVTSNYKDAIKCKDDLKFISGTYEITSVDDAIVGKDSISIKDGSFLITCEGDGLKATNAEETDKGYIMIDDGTLQITSTGDGIVAETLLRVNDGILNIVSGNYSDENTNSNMQEFGPGGQMQGMQNMSSANKQMPGGNMPGGGRGNAQNFDPNSSTETTEDSVSTKGMKSYVELVIAGGDITIASEDDALHSDQNVTVDNGTLSIASNDDGVHAEKVLTINNGTVDITQSYEGLEAFDIIINDGTISLTASDDGINAAGDADSAANPEDDNTSDSEGTVTNDFSNFRGAGGMMAAENQGATLTINGGTIQLTAEGDVIDINGDGVVNGGAITAQGPTSGGNGTLDYASSFVIESGSFWGVGSAQMAMNPSSDSQGIIAGTVQETISEGTEISIKDTFGNVVTTFTVQKQGQWIGISTPDIEKESSYTILIGTSEYSATAS